MSTFVKISLTLLGLVVALLLLLVVRVVTLDPNDYRDWITGRFEEQTGRRLTLAGNIGLSIYPWLGLSVEDVTVDNPPGFGETPLLVAERASVRVKLLPLLRERYEIDTVQLQGVSLNLLVNQSGDSNWQDLAGEGGDTVSSEQRSDSGLPLTRLVIGGVDVRDVNVRYEDQQNNVFYEVSDLLFNIGELVYGTPIDLTMTFDAATNRPQLTADVQLTGTLNYDLDNGRYSLAPLRLTSRLSGPTIPDGGAEVGLSAAVDVDLGDDSLSLRELILDGLGTSLTASVQGQAISSSRPVFQGDVAIDGSDLATLFSAAGAADLAARLSSVNDRSFQVNASAALTGGAAAGLSVPSLQASLLGADLTGNLEVTESGGQPRAAGNLQASGPDLPLVVEVLGQLSGGEQSTLVQVAREMRQVSSRAFDLNLEFDADMETGNVTVPTLEARLVGASVSGRLQGTDIDSETPSLNGSLRASGPNLPLLLQIGARLQGGAGSPLFQTAERLRTSIDGSFTIDAEFDVNLEEGNIAVPSLAVDALGFAVAGELNAAGMADRSGSMSGRLTVESVNPAPLVAAIGQEALAEVLQRVSVNLALSGSRTDLAVTPLRASITVAGPRIPNSPVDLQMNAAARINLERESMTVDAFDLNGLGLDVSGMLEVERLLDDPYYQGRVELAEFNLRNFLQQLNQPLPAMRDPAALQRVGLETRFEGSSSRIALDGLALVLDETSLLGNVAINSFTEPSAEFTIEVDRLNVDSYLAPTMEDSPQTLESGEETSIPVDQLRNLTLLGEVRAGELTAAGLTLNSVYLTVNAADGELNLAPLAAELYQGSFEGAARLSVTGSVPAVSLEADLQSVDLEPLLLDLLDASYLSGRASVDLAVTGSGATAAAMKQTLSGGGRLVMEEGVLRGVDVAGVLRQLETMIRSRRPGDLQRGTSTAFDSFASTISISDGVVRSDDMLIESPGFRVTGRGTLVNLATNSIDFNLTTTVDQSTASVAAEEFDIGGYSLPIACTGTLEQPRCLPDAGEILRARLQREVQNRVIDLLDRSLGVDRDQPATQSGTTQAPAASPPSTPTTSPAPAETQNQQPATQTEPRDLGEQLINRALERIFN